MRTQQQTAATVIGWLREGRRVAAGLLASVDGSAPLDVGASVYIDEHGNVEGSITGGCVESAVAQEAQFKTTYNISIVALEEAKGTLLAYDNIAVAECPHPRR